MSFLAHKSATRKEAEKQAHRFGGSVQDLSRTAARESEHYLHNLQKKVGSLMNDSHFDERRNQLARTGREASASIGRHPVATVLLAAGALAVVGYFLTRSRKNAEAEENPYR